MTQAGQALEQNRGLRQTIGNLDQGEELIFRDLLLEIRTLLQQRFVFDSELPDWIETELRPLFKAFEDDLVRRRRSYPQAVHQGLALYHETMAVQYGLCGQGFWDALEEQVRLAQDCLGRGRIPLYLDAWRRQWAWLVYARLENGDLKGAETALCRCLGIDDLARLQVTNLTEREHGLLARFATESGRNFAICQRWAERYWSRVELRPPWLAWLYNIGRTVQTPEWRQALWQRCLDGCFQQGADWLQIVGLLPLAALHKQGLGEAHELESKTKQALRYVQNGPVHQEHFQPILGVGSWEQSLEAVWCDQKMFFPFHLR